MVDFKNYKIQYHFNQVRLENCEAFGIGFGERELSHTSAPLTYQT